MTHPYDTPQVGDDVEYTVQRQNSDGKLSAVAIRRAPPGSVVFDVVSEEAVRGVLLEKPAPTKQASWECSFFPCCLRLSGTLFF